MIELYTASRVIQVLITLILGFCVLAQVLAMLLKFYRHNQTKQGLIEGVFEFTILFGIFILALLHGELINGYRYGIVVSAGYEYIRISAFLIIMIVGIAVCLLNKNLWQLSAIIAAIILLPIMEKILGQSFPWFFVATLIFFFIRSVKNCKSSLNAIKTNLSALSIIRALDTLHTGVLFCESDGYVVLSNHQMQRLMLLITGKVFYNAIEFYDILMSDEYKSRYEKVQLEGQAVFLLPDGTAWMFTKTEIPFSRKKYIHISATDVSENWALTTKIRQQDRELRIKSNELKNTISNLHILSEEKEIEKARRRAHDIIGQRLTVLLRMMQSEEKLDYDLLASLSKGLLDELKIGNDEKNAFDELKSIQQIFASIGVDIKFTGELPPDEKQAFLFVDIIREGSTNAVRHGFATQVDIEVKKTKDVYKLFISDNGHASVTPITPGSGIKAMKENIAANGGSLAITAYPRFELSVVLPGGDNSV